MVRCQHYTARSRYWTDQCKREATAHVWYRTGLSEMVHEADFCTFHANRRAGVQAMRPIAKEDR